MSSFQKPNALIFETSPYLLQHAYNPVEWYPWGPEALQKAKAENKVMIISIGYSACHWCHVMEKECFEDPEIAQIMNQYFVNIKVDREERPDIDQIYMDALHVMKGSGGWPLNCFATPEGKPIYGGTYFPKSHWKHILLQIASQWYHEKEKLIAHAERITQSLSSLDYVDGPNQENKLSFQKESLDEAFLRLKASLDNVHGGTQRVPKFPMPVLWEFLLKWGHLNCEESAIRAVELTLEKMAYGGIYDQIGGGFARYSTDQIWLVPHFEKMLYDNAQLVVLYTHAWQKTYIPLYRQVVVETLDFVERELTSSEGGFFTALDADSQGEEGKYYVWTTQEIEAILGEKAALLSLFYNFQQRGNWEEGKNIPYRTRSEAEFAELTGRDREEFEKWLQEAKQKLLQIRLQRPRPTLDDKIITSWNAMMNKAYTTAYRALGETHYLQKAETNMQFLLSNLYVKSEILFRTWKNGKAKIPAFLDDYAFLIDALLSLYQATFNEEYIEIAEKLLQQALVSFEDKNSALLFYTANTNEPLITRKKEIQDNVIPSSNAIMAHNLLTLAHLLSKEEYEQKAIQMMRAVVEEAIKYPAAYAHWLLLLSRFIFPDYEVAICGPDYKRKRADFEYNYLPNVILLGIGGKNNGHSKLPLLQHKWVDEKTQFFVCQNKTCQLPVDSVSKVLDMIAPCSNNKPSLSNK
ncbi:MAG: thioredoxin domain-containing protein [Bacteroidia bacterium]|nr:thioredoxin domain-containing protein [Bacteroidia bacterium]MDW8159092.1 thioredoxin domain-containing protein [Bacteroidia bacterium]